MSKTVGIDARFYGEAGPGRYAKAIVEHLEKVDTINHYIVFLRQKGFEAYVPKNTNFKKVLADYPWYSLQEQTLFLFKLLMFKLDVLYVPHFNIPILYPKKIVTAIPDIIMHSFSTEHSTTRSMIIHKFKKFLYHVVVYFAVTKSQKIIVPSLDVKTDFMKYYPYVSESKYIVAYEGVDPDLATAKIFDHKIDGNLSYLLYVGSMYKHKNIPILIEAFKILKSKYGYNGKLIIVGKKDFFSEQIFKSIKEANLETVINMPGMDTYIPDSKIVELRRNAELCVFPSLKEGFSLTPLEGMAVGLPAVISDIPCHKEIYGDSVVYFDPTSAGDFAEKIWQTINDKQLQQKLRSKGYELLKKYDWSKTAQITLAVLNS